MEYRICYENYEISDTGLCRKLCKNGNYIEIKGSISNKGYRYFQLQRNGKRINLHFHVMVAKCFIGERPQDLVVDHIDRNKLNNNVNNLRYITQLENCRNTCQYRNDIKEKDFKKRRLIFSKESYDKIKTSGLYKCEICCLSFGGSYQFNRHINGNRHKKKKSIYVENNNLHKKIKGCIFTRTRNDKISVIFSVSKNGKKKTKSWAGYKIRTLDEAMNLAKEYQIEYSNNN